MTPSSSPQPRSVLVIDDHDIVRFALETVVLNTPELRLVGSASTLAEGLALIREQSPDLVITDIALPDSKGTETVRAVVAAQAGRRTLVVSMQDELLYGEVALGAGADGYLMKDTAHANIVQAALAVLDGETWVSPALRARMLDRFLQRKRPADQAAEASLTVREREVLEQLKQGKTTKEIARALGISARTVDLHRATIKRKLGLRTGVELVAYAFNRL